MRFSTTVLPLLGLGLNIGLSSAKLVQEVLELSWDYGAPNGGEPRQMVLTNGQYPGPDLVWDEGDDIEVLVINNMPFNTTVHWHGLEMRDTPWSDGVPGLSQSPIEPDETYLYKFKAYPAGTYWYHSHYKGLMQDGQVGSLYIRRKPDAPRPYSTITEDEEEHKQMQEAENDPHLILVTDWTYLTAEEYHRVAVDSGFNFFCVDNLLINGKGSVYCPGYEYLESVGGTGIDAVLEGTHLTEKGCLQPDLYNVQGDYGPWDESIIPDQLVYNCTPSETPPITISVNPDTNPWTSLNFIAGSAQKGLTFSLDNHTMWVYEVDGHLVQPIPVEMVGVYNGARYSVLVKLDQKPGEYTLRVSDNGGDQVMGTYAILWYENAPVDPENADDVPQASIGPFTSGYMNYGGFNTTPEVRELVFTENLPVFDAPPPPPSSEVASTLRTSMTRINNSWAWSLGNQALYETEITASTPLLFETDPLSLLPEDVAYTTTNGTWVDIVLEIHANSKDPIHPPHPIHKHGSHAYIMGRGTGPFEWKDTAEAERAVPESFYGKGKIALRDTFVMDFFDSRRMGGAWMVIRYFVTGRFASLLHCHIVSHQMAGMSLPILDGVDVWDTVEEGEESYRLREMGKGV
ncbi:laccase-1 [Aspergillus karnatakaensis]|uniref:multicopper oxidase n=1 Tax=Aspergillus karnatakaensis TaxID=1810916 RepID=UPI003CCD28EA